MNLNEMISIDLPSLQSIQLGEYTLEGRDDPASPLIMKGRAISRWMILL